MFRGFNVSLLTNDIFEESLELGEKIFSAYKDFTKDTIDNYLLENNSINGTLMQNDWFPSVSADVFISHSHKDRDLAIGLAGWLYKNFKLNSFIDSCVWGYANELLLSIDKKYCLNEGATNTYNYDKRNYSTSHVHMMLSTALAIMMDKCECIFLLNTDNSINTSSVINKTDSPWLYSEITMSKLLRIQKPKRYDLIQKAEDGTKLLSESEKKRLRIEYDIDLKHLVELNQSALKKWELNHAIGSILRGIHPLDHLYELFPLPKI